MDSDDATYLWLPDQAPLFFFFFFTGVARARRPPEASPAAAPPTRAGRSSWPQNCVGGDATRVDEVGDPLS